MNLIDHLIELLRREPWLTAGEAAARLNLPVQPDSVRNALTRWSLGPFARLRRVNGVYRYALYQETTPPPSDD